MDFPDSADRTSLPQLAEPPAPASVTAPASAARLVSVICGIAACALNLLLITAPLGLLFAIAGLIGGIVAGKSGSAGRAGFVLIFVSLFILLIYAASAVVPILADPTARLLRG